MGPAPREVETTNFNAQMAIRIAGVDPGYRNLGIVVFDYEPIDHKVTLVESMHIDVGRARNNEHVLLLLTDHLNFRLPFQNVQLVAIEDQDIGLRNTKPINLAISWIIAVLAMHQNPFVDFTFYASKEKFKEFEAKLPSRKGQSKHKRRRVVKECSIQLAVELLQEVGIEPSAVFKPGKKQEWEHLADAVGLAFTRIRRLAGEHLSSVVLPKD